MDRKLGPVRFKRTEQRLFNLSPDRLQPSFGVCGAVLEMLYIAFKLLNAIFCGSQLDGEPVGHGHGSVNILLRESGGLLEHGNKRLPRFINGTTFAVRNVPRRESHDRHFLRLLFHLLTPPILFSRRPNKHHSAALARIYVR
jgi:hypothetical protein